MDANELRILAHWLRPSTMEEICADLGCGILAENRNTATLYKQMWNMLAEHVGADEAYKRIERAIDRL